MRWFTVVSLLCLAGCSGQQEPKEPFAPNQQLVDESGFVLVIGIDLSGSFHHLMTKDGKAYEFTCNVLDKYLRDRIGTQNEVIIAQLSGSNKPLLWQGTPGQLRADFDDADAFRVFLEQRADSRGSRLYSGMSDIIAYTLTQPSVVSGKKRCVMLILSDMDDNAPNPEKSKPRLIQSLKNFAKADGRIGMYWVSQLNIAEWQKNLTDAGFKNFVLESEIKSNPALPNFE